MDHKLVTVRLYFPCCGRQSYRYVKARGPCAKHFTVNHLGCDSQFLWNIKINLDWNQQRTKLRASVKWLERDYSRPWPTKYPLLTMAGAPTMGA